jgi:hypothetical protein
MGVELHIIMNNIISIIIPIITWFETFSAKKNREGSYIVSTYMNTVRFVTFVGKGENQLDATITVY